MNIERYDNGSVEVTFSFTTMSYLAFTGSVGCFLGILYFWLIEGLEIFSVEIIGLVVAGVILGAVGIIIYERSRFFFDNDKSQLVYSKKKYFKNEKGVVPFYDIQEIAISRDSDESSEMFVEVVTKVERISLTETHMISTDFEVEEFVGDVKGITGLGIDTSPKNRAQILLDLGQTNAALNIIREEMDMSLDDAKRYMGISE